MPRFEITNVEWDENNLPHATRRASAEQIEDVLLGVRFASKNKKKGTAKFTITDKAQDGTKWRVVFNYKDGSARPITAWPA